MMKRLQMSLLLFWFGVHLRDCDAFIKSRYACQGEKLRIRCNSRIIKIYSANYGRTEPGSSICPNENASSTSCKSLTALKIVIDKCTNKARCNIKADGSMFPDPCPTTFKYLDVVYGCVPRPDTMTTTKPSTRKHRRRTTPRYRRTTTAAWVTETEVKTTPTTAPTTPDNPTHGPATTPVNTTPTHNTSSHNTTNSSFPSTLSLTTNTEQRAVIIVTAPASTVTVPPKRAKSGYVQREQPKYVLILFLSGVAIATVLLLILLLGLHFKGRRSKKFVMEQEKDLEPNDEDDRINEEDDSDDDDDDETKNVTIEIQGGDDETKQISVKPGDIIIIDNKEVDNDDSEDLGYMSEIVRYYNSRNMAQDDGKQSLTCETPSVNSIANSEGDKREQPFEDTEILQPNGECVS